MCPSHEPGLLELFPDRATGDSSQRARLSSLGVGSPAVQGEADEGLGDRSVEVTLVSKT